MAISALVLHWLGRLKRRGIWSGGSMLELGPQHMLTTKDVVEQVLNDLFEPEKAEQVLSSMLRGDNWWANAQIPLYQSLGAASYVSMDLLHTGSRYRFDLNNPVEIGETFDIVTNFGTSEHIFNIGTSFENADRLVAQNGLLLMILPTFGHINHGFYNIHPTLYFDFAKANDYLIEDILYIDNFGVRCRLAEKPGAPAPDFDAFPIRLDPNMPDAKLERAVVDLFVKNVQADETRAYMDEFPMICFDYVFAALRRRRADDQPFTAPLQGLYQSN